MYHFSSDHVPEDSFHLAMFLCSPSLTDHASYGSNDVSTGVSLAKVTGAMGCLCLCPHLGIVMRRDVNDRGGILDRGEPLAQVQPGHPFELDVKQQAIKMWTPRILEKSFSRRISDRLKVCGPQQPAHRLAKALVIINDRDIDVSGASHGMQCSNRHAGLSTAL